MDRNVGRAGRSATDARLQDGLALFVQQLIRTPAIEQTGSPTDSRSVSGPAGGAAHYRI